MEVSVPGRRTTRRTLIDPGRIRWPCDHPGLGSTDRDGNNPLGGSAAPTVSWPRHWRPGRRDVALDKRGMFGSKAPADGTTTMRTMRPTPTPGVDMRKPHWPDVRSIPDTARGRSSRLAPR